MRRKINIYSGLSVLAVVIMAVFILSCSSKAERYYKSGRLLQSKGQLIEAIEYFQKAIDLDPHMVEAYKRQGELYLRLGQEDKSIETFKRAIIVAPDYYKAYRRLGKIYRATGQLEKARQVCNQALARKGIDGDPVEKEKIKQLLEELNQALAPKSAESVEQK